MNPHPERESLGRTVREVWVAWAKEQANPKPHWPTPWGGLAEADKEVDRRIGEVLFTLGTDRLGQWERLFETTNPPQAHAEHRAVLAKRDALVAELQRLKEELTAAQLKIAELKAAADSP